MKTTVLLFCISLLSNVLGTAWGSEICFFHENGANKANKVILLEEFEQNGRNHLRLKYFEDGYPKNEAVLEQWKRLLVEENRIKIDLSTLTDYYMVKNDTINYFITEQIKSIGPDHGKGFYVDEIQLNGTRFLKPSYAKKCRIGDLY